MAFILWTCDFLLIFGHNFVGNHWLPLQGLMVIYVFTLGWMVVFAFLVATLGSAGSRLRRAAKRSPAPVSSIMRALESRQAATLLACAVVFAAHVQKFSLPPTFRTPTLQGENMQRSTRHLVYTVIMPHSRPASFAFPTRVLCSGFG